jgi:cell wall assembly regulator SMI1
MSDIELVFKCYKTLLLHIAPLVYNSFATGATDEDIAILRQLPVDIPSEMIELYRISNGEIQEKRFYESTQKNINQLKLFPVQEMVKEKIYACGAVLGGWRFLTINEIVSYRYSPLDSSDWANYEYKDNFSVYPPDTINLFSYKHRIPFASNNSGSYLGIDLNPAENGCMNQIICYGRDFEIEYVVATSLKDFFILMIDEIGKGNFYTANNHQRTINPKKIDWFSIGKIDSDIEILKCVYPNKEIIRYAFQKIQQDEKIPLQYKKLFKEKRTKKNVGKQ